MGLFSALTASVSGLTSQGEAISVISDNLANTNTVGFRAGRALFSQLVTTGSGSGTFNAGGAQSIVQRSQDTQGSVIGSTSGTDIAISGSGFFAVTDSQVNDSNTETFFTRAGSFAEDNNGFLVNPSGLFLQGIRTDVDGEPIDAQNIEAIELQSVGVSAAATDEIRIGANLTNTQPNSAVFDTTTSLAADIDAIVADPGTNADFVTDIRIFDAQGSARDVSVAYTKRASNLYDFALFTDGSNVEGATTGVNSLIASGTLRFNDDGTLRSVSGADDITVDFQGGVENGAFDINFGDATGGSIVTGTTGLDFTDNVLDIAIEDDSTLIDTTAPAGAYTLSLTAADTFTLTAPNGQTSTINTAGAANQELVFTFANAGAGQRDFSVRATVSNSFATTAGAFPVNSSFDVAAVAPIGTGGGSNGVVQFAAAFGTSFATQTGFGSGTLSNIQIDADGFISGTFTNGQSQRLFQIVVADFPNSSALTEVSGTLLQTTGASGDPLFRNPGENGTGTLIAGALEGSTVDIATEFSNMIVAQRAYQANSTVLSTVDQMLNELLNIR